MTYPQQLPEKPEGWTYSLIWTRSLIRHFNYGTDGGSATYSVKDADGQKMPFVYGYDTQKPPVKGFKLPGDEVSMTWEQLRARWPEWVREQEQTAPEAKP